MHGRTHRRSVFGWLNDVAPLNMPLMSLTLDTSQPPMSSLKPFLALKSPPMSLTPLVSHSPIGPYCAIAAARSVHQSFTAARSLAFAALPPQRRIVQRGARSLTHSLYSKPCAQAYTH